MTDLLTLDNTAIVLDSTCDAPSGWLQQPGLFMVPLKVHFGDQMYRDGVDMTPAEFFAKLEQADVLPTTSQPTAGEFVAAYEEARRQYEHVFSLHISGEMSGTVRAAEQAAEMVDHVYVYDMRRSPPRSMRVSACAPVWRPAARWTMRTRTRVITATTATARPRRDPSICVAAVASAVLPRFGGVSTSNPIAAVDGTLAATPRCAGSRRRSRPCSAVEDSRPGDEVYFASSKR
jgi:hypothetical protein